MINPEANSEPKNGMNPFPISGKDKMRLPEAKVGIWGGFVFVNFDPDCEPLESYLENGWAITPTLVENSRRFA